MKKLLLAAIVAAAVTVRSHAVPVPNPDAPAPAPVAVVATPDPNLFPIGPAFGPSKHWQLGIDKSNVAGACAGWAFQAHQAMAGPCRNVLDLDRNQEPTFHAGVALLYGSRNTAVTPRLGFNIGPAAKATLQGISDRIPGLEQVSGWQAPGFLQDLGKVSSVDYAMNWIGGKRNDVISAEVDLPVDVLMQLLGVSK